MKLHSEKEFLEKYSKDRSIYKIKPKYVAFPKTEEEIIKILVFARRKRISVTARGGGTGLSGAAIGRGIVISFEKFNKILKTGRITRTQSGVLINKLRPTVRKAGYMLPSSPLHEYCAIGGNVNTRYVGPRTIKYGSTDKQIKSLRGILADGRILDTSKIIPKDIAKKISLLQEQIKKDKIADYIKKRPALAGGYNLKALFEYKGINDVITHLIVSSTGTLLLLTEIELSLPRFKKLADLYLLHFKDFNSLQKVMNSLLKKGAVSVEYAGKEALELWNERYHKKDAVAGLIVGFEKTTDVSEILKNTLSTKKIPPNKRPHLWKSRALTLPKLEDKAKKLGLQLPSGIDDTTFYPKDFADIMHEIKKYEKRKGVMIASFGHIGIGSLHLRPFIDMKKNPEELDKIGRDIFKILRKYNGTLVGEHNSGLCRSRYLAMESKKMYEYMRKIKKIFDPDNILNPKVVFNLDPITKNIEYKKG